jgi:5'-3' exonuclease
MSDQRPVLIVDAMNAFVRCWAAFPQMSAHGYQMGGCIGFLKTLRKIVSETQPSAIYIAWEAGGSQRRRAIFTEYKLGRRPEKLNRYYGDDIPDTDENRQHQMITLLGMLKCVPVCQIYVTECEGDDVIAHLCCGPLKSHDKIIVSSDKDLYQLLDDKTKLYSLHKKTFVLPQNVLDDFRVTSENFAIAKSLCGDPGDNVPGIKGIGFKTVSKLFPFLGTEHNIVLQDVFDYCHSHSDESSLYRRIIEQQDDVKRNWKLVFLNGNMLSSTQATKVDSVINTHKPITNKMGLVKLLVKEGISDFDTENFFYPFHCIEGIEYK